MFDLIVIGGGPAGLAAACSAWDKGLRKILIVERDQELGGILNQCIHSGFGLQYFKEVENRILSIAHYTVDHNSTVRSTARKFGISKSTVHKDLTERLPQIDHHLAEEVRDILDVNKSERHIRGGMATRRKYLQLQR